MRTFLVLGVALFAACAGARRSEDPVARDNEIVRDISWQFQRDVRFRYIEVSCREGIVKLDGWVTTEDDREEAEAIAWGTASVRQVESALRVRAR